MQYYSVGGSRRFDLSTGLQVYAMSSREGFVEPSLKLEKVGDVYVPLQNGIVYPSFELQKSRQYVDLGGEWRVYFDPYASHDLTLMYRSADVLKELSKDGFHLLTYDDSSWEVMRIPSSFNLIGSRYEHYQGVVWYRRFFRVPQSSEGKFVKLVFQGVNYFTDVWVNGFYVGYHEGGFTPFAFDISSYLDYSGDNLIVVRVDNIPWGTSKVIVPYAVCDWKNYGGIYREVYLEIAESVHIDRVDVVSKQLDEQVDLEVRVVVSNHDVAIHKASLTLEIYGSFITAENIIAVSPVEVMDLSRQVLPATLIGEVEVEPGGFRVVGAILRDLDIHRWSPSNPALYVAKAVLYIEGFFVEDFYVQFGVRDVRVNGVDLLLNGEPVFLKGLARHEEYPDTGRTVTVEKIYQDLRVIEEMGANWIRTAHYPNHPYTYILTDRLGLLVWEEIPVYWFDDEGFSIQVVRGVARQMLLEMVFRDYNRASIVIWGLANECSGYGWRVKFLNELVQLVEKVDPSRLTAQAIVWNPYDDSWEKSGCDLIAVNEYFGVFYGSLSDLSRRLDDLHESFPNVPILITEFGLWSDGDEEEQAEYFQRSWDILSSKPYIAGVCWWTAFDYYGRVFNTFGVLDWSRSHRKLVFFQVQKAYNSRRVMRVGSQRFLWGGLDRLFPFMVLISATLLITCGLLTSSSGKLGFEGVYVKLMLAGLIGLYFLVAIIYLLLGVLARYIGGAWIPEFELLGLVMMAIGLATVAVGFTILYLYVKYARSG
jgi:beta-glucuronidase